MPSELQQWPVQLHLLSPTAPWLKKANLLVAADCTAYSAGDFHTNWLRGKRLAIACPKLDHGQEIYLEKLITMIDEGGIDTLTVMIMEVPCCCLLYTSWYFHVVMQYLYSRTMRPNLTMSIY